MGKFEEEGATVSNSEETDPTTETNSCFFIQFSLRCLLPVVLGFYVLVFSVWLIFSRGSDGGNALAPSSDSWKPHIEASFRLRKSATAINASLPQLQLDLQNEIGIPDTQIDIIDLVQLPPSNWTEVRFSVSPDPSNDSIAPAEISLLKDTFVELFMQRAENLSLTNDIFGEVSHFEVLHFPGGITVVPEQPGFPLSKVLVLFNFTLHNSLSHITSNFAEFRNQLANGIVLKPNENLFVQLTNLDGSTLKSPLIVQTSILPVVGVLLPRMRLKQLAQEILASPQRNLGLNHTLFGKVKEIELSSYLEYTLRPTQAPSPSPTPTPTPTLTPAPSPLFKPDWECNPCSPRKAQVKKKGYEGSPLEATSYTTKRGGCGGSQNDRHHGHNAWDSGGLAPSPSTLPPSPKCYALPPSRSSSSHPSNAPYYSPLPLPSPPLEMAPANIHVSSSPSPTTGSWKSPSTHRNPSKGQSPLMSPYSQPSPAIAPPEGGTSPLSEGSIQAEGPTFFKAPLQAPEGFTPGPIFGHSPTSSAAILNAHSWIFLLMVILLLGIW